MISHTFIGITDYARAFAFYTRIMGVLGLPLKFDNEANHMAAWMPNDRPRPLFLIGKPANGQPATPGNGQMIALQAADRPTVDAVYAMAMASGGICEGQPGLRPQYHADYYGAYFRDPDGNKLCVCCHHPAKA